MPQASSPAISLPRIAFASFIGTAIEFYDFYIYAMAAALVIGQVFFPASDAAAQSLNAFLTFGIAFVARPLGAAIFGHFGDRIGRKATLAATLIVMGLCTLLIGLLPGYATMGVWAPVILSLLRFGQGLGLGGEWGGAALLATEHAPPGQRGWYGMFPQLGPAAGFLLATLSFLVLAFALDEQQFRLWGWRIPFLVSAALVAVGLYVRVRLTETPAFAAAQQRHATLDVPLLMLLRRHLKPVLLGSLAMVVCYSLFYTATVFCLSYGTAELQIPRTQFLAMLCFAVVWMAVATPLSAWASDRYGRRPVLLLAAAAAILVGFSLAPMMHSGSLPQITLFLSLALFVMGMSFAPMGALLPELFPVAVRYSGAGMAYQLGGIFGASFAPYISQLLVTRGGLEWVGGYVAMTAVVSLLAVLALGETRQNQV